MKKNVFERDKCVFHVLTPKNLFLLLRTSLTLNAQLVHLRFEKISLKGAISFSKLARSSNQIMT